MVNKIDYSKIFEITVNSQEEYIVQKINWLKKKVN